MDHHNGLDLHCDNNECPCEERESILSAVETSNKRLVRKLVLHDYSEEWNERGMNFIHVAADKELYGIMKILLKDKRYINSLVRPSQVSVEVNRLGYSALHFSALRKNKKLTNLLVLAGANSNPIDSFRRTPLHIAAANGSLSITKALLRNGSDPIIFDNFNNTPLFYSVKSDNIAITKHILSNSEYQEKCNVFMLFQTAVIYNAVKTVNYFLDRFNIDVDFKSNLSKTLYHYHVAFKKRAKNKYQYNEIKGDVEIIQQDLDVKYSLTKLISHFDNKVNEDDISKVSTLHIAAAAGHKEIVSFLLDSNADVNTVNNKNATPLHLVAKNGNLEICKQLLDKQCNVNAKLLSGITPLHIAIKNNHFLIIKELLQHKANVNVKDNWDRTPLSMACEANAMDIIEQIMEHDDKLKNTGHNQTLEYAIKNKYVDVVKAILEPNINVSFSKSKHKILVTMSLDVKNLSLIQLFQENDYELQFLDKDALFSCYSDGNNTKLLAAVIQSRTNINKKNRQGDAILHLACKDGNISIVKLLIENLCDVNVQNKNKMTALHLACMKRHVDIVEALLMGKASVDAKDAFGETPLLYLLRSNHTSSSCSQLQILDKVSLNEKLTAILNMLITYKCDLNICNTLKHTTALHLAVLSGNSDIIEILLNNGARTDMFDLNNDTSLQFAISLGNEDIIKKLVKCNSKADMKDTVAKTAVCFAITQHKTDIAKIIYGMSQHYLSSTQKGDLLITAATVNNYKFAKFICDSGVEMNEINGYGLKCLKIAIDKRHKSFLVFMLDYGFDIKLIDPERLINKGNYEFLLSVIPVHFIKLLIANYDKWISYVKSKWVPELINYIVPAELCNSCWQEIKKLKVTIDDINISLNDILVAEPNILVSYAKNDVLVNAVRQKHKEYPFYGKMILYKIEKALRRSNLVQDGTYYFNFLLKDISCMLPHDCIGMIFEYLDNKDLKTIIDMFYINDYDEE